jgi:carboxyl-terminal processing protease
LMENCRGDVVGDKTFGVGSVQKVIEIPDGSALILSIAKYYTPSGKAIQDTAITPNVLVADAEQDIVLPDDDENTAPSDQDKKIEKQRQDDQLHKAIDILKTRQAKS